MASIRRSVGSVMAVLVLSGGLSSRTPLANAASGHACQSGENPTKGEIHFASGMLRTFGQQTHSCTRDDAGNVLVGVEDRDGDYAMCCVELAKSLNLSGYTSARADVTVTSEEQKVEVKLEDGPKQIFVFDGRLRSAARPADGHTFRPDERKWRPTMVCVSAVGGGPVPNTVRLEAIRLEGCR